MPTSLLGAGLVGGLAFASGLAWLLSLQLLGSGDQRWREVGLFTLPRLWLWNLVHGAALWPWCSQGTRLSWAYGNALLSLAWHLWLECLERFPAGLAYLGASADTTPVASRALRLAMGSALAGTSLATGLLWPEETFLVLAQLYAGWLLLCVYLRTRRLALLLAGQQARSAACSAGQAVAQAQPDRRRLSAMSSRLGALQRATEVTALLCAAYLAVWLWLSLGAAPPPGGILVLGLLAALVPAGWTHLMAAQVGQARVPGRRRAKPGAARAGPPWPSVPGPGGSPAGSQPEGAARETGSRPQVSLHGPAPTGAGPSHSHSLGCGPGPAATTGPGPVSCPASCPDQSAPRRQPAGAPAPPPGQNPPSSPRPGRGANRAEDAGEAVSLTKYTDGLTQKPMPCRSAPATRSRTLRTLDAYYDSIPLSVFRQLAPATPPEPGSSLVVAWTGAEAQAGQIFLAEQRLSRPPRSYAWDADDDSSPGLSILRILPSPRAAGQEAGAAAAP